MSDQPSRYEPRSNPPGAYVPGLWGAWDLRSEDWVRTGRGGVVIFTSRAEVLTWAAKQLQPAEDAGTAPQP